MPHKPRAGAIAPGLVAVVLTLACACAAAGDIVIGRTLPLSGPISAYGHAKSEGGELVLRQVNAKGGINGKKLVVLTLDDGYDPERAESNVRDLANKHGAVALLNTLGVAVVSRLQPVLAELKLPAVGLSTGAATVREPPQRYVFPVRAGYREEGELAVKLLKSIGLTRVMLVEQDDPLGQTVADGYRQSMHSVGLRLVDTIKMKRDQPDTASVVDALQRANPQAVLLALSALPASELVKRYRAAGGTARLYAMSVTDMTQIAKLAGDHATAFGFSQIVPLPVASSGKVVREYLEAARGGGHVPSFYGLEGYLEARVLVEALRRTGARITREGVTDSLERMHKLDLGGYAVEYGSENRRGSSFVEMVIIGPGGRLVR